MFDDSLEFQVVLPTLGIAHPSGYPLYTLLGKLFTLLLPFRDPGRPVESALGLCAGATVGILYLLARKVGEPAVAATEPAVFALSPAWWSQATVAEVYALHGLFFGQFPLPVAALGRDAMAGDRRQVKGKGVRGRGQEPGARRQRATGSFQPPTSKLQRPTLQSPASNDRYLAAAAFVCGLGWHTIG